MVMQTIATPPGGGLSTVQELYDMINGKTTTQSGGTTTQDNGTSTKTENSSISQEGMNEMLKSALANTNGLAAISQGQRTAGGYGSVVNQMLTNDLMTRTASQIAQNNVSKTTTTSNPTVTTSTPQTTTTVGGATVAGTAKSAGFLSALQMLGKSGAGDWLKKQLGVDSKDAAAVNTSTGAAANPVQYGSQSAFEGTPATGVGYSLPAGFGSSIDASIGASYGTVDAGTPNDFAVGTTNSASPASPADYTANTFDPTAFDAAPNYTVPDLGVTDTVSAPAYEMPATADPFLFGFADGGAVNTKKQSSQVLGSSQFNTVTDPSAKLNGATTLSDNPVTAAAQATQNAPTATTAPTSNAPATAQATAPATSGNSGGNSGGTETSAGTKDAGAGISAKNVASGLGVVGALTGNRDLSTLGTVVGIANSSNPAAAAIGAVANVASRGVTGALTSVFRDPSLANITDAGLSMAVPGVGLFNAMADTIGIGSVGQIAQNAISMAMPNNPVSPAMQASVNQDQAATDAATASAADNGVTTTPVEAQNSDLAVESLAPMSVSDLGLADTGPTEFGPGSGGTYSGGFDNGYSSQSQGNAGDAGGVGGGDGSMGGYGGSASAADGGAISGPGTEVSDSIHAKLSDGEFVLSADVVKAIGVDKLQALQDKYHVPAAVQKLQSYGKGRG